MHLVRAAKNSLNNRMLPYDVTDTDCVLQMDDDTRNVDVALVKQGLEYVKHFRVARWQC